METNEKKPEVEIEESPKILEAEIVEQTLPQRIEQTQRYHIYDSVIASQVRLLASFGLAKGNVSLASKISVGILDKYYMQDYLEGQAEMQKGLAKVAISEAMNGNTPVLIHLLKTKLGWNETHQLEVSGEVRSVVSAKPLTKEEFVQKYLTKNEESE